jgi:dimethylsulfone monooxygenase
MNAAETPIRSACWVPNASGGLVISDIEQRTGWDIDYNRKLARIAEATPDQVRRNPEVVRACIGAEAA